MQIQRITVQHTSQTKKNDTAFASKFRYAAERPLEKSAKLLTATSIIFPVLQLTNSIKKNEELLDNKTLKFFFRDYPEIEPKDFYAYVNNVDTNKLKKDFPILNSYNTSNWSNFFMNHYLLGTQEFTKEALTCPKDLSEILSKKYLAAYLVGLLDTFPNTNRNVGELPLDWFKDTDDRQEKNAEVREILAAFRGRMSKWRLLKDLEKEKAIADTEAKLSKALGKKTKIEKLDLGNYATGYKINVDSAKPVVIKIFHSYRTYSRDHGQWAEVPRGLYLNKYPDKFAHLFFGKVPHINTNDGYLVTEFLEDDGILHKIEPYFEKEECSIECSDIDVGENVKQGKIFDFGGVYIYPKKREYPLNILKILEN